MASGIVSDLSWYRKLHNIKKMCKQSSQQSDQSCFCTNTRTTRTRQNNPYRLGAVRAGVVRARGRCCPAATVPVAVVLPCGVCCRIAANKQNTIINRNPELCHHRLQTKAHSNEYENNTHKAEHASPAWRGVGMSSRGTKPLLSSSDGARSCRITLRCMLLYC